MPRTRGIRAAFAALVAALSPAGCAEDPADPVGSTQQATAAFMVMLPVAGTVVFPGAPPDGALLATIDAHGAADAHGVEKAAALFLPLAPAQVYAGRVAVNGFPPDTIRLSPSSVCYAASGDLAGVAFDGSPHVWAVAGHPPSGISPFTLSVSSPSVAPLITGPAAGTVVRRASGLTVRWTGTAAADSVLVSVADVQGSLAAVTAFGGTAALGAEALGALQPGPASVTVQAYRTAGALADGKRIAAMAASVDTRGVTLQ